MFLIDCKNVNIDTIKKLEEILILNNLTKKVIIDYNKSYITEYINIKKLNDKQYIKYLKKSQAIFLFNKNNINFIKKYNSNIFVLHDIDDLVKIINPIKYKNKYRKSCIFLEVLVILLICCNSIILKNIIMDKEKENKIKEDTQVKKVVETKKTDYKNENIVFAGDSITDFYDTNKYFDGYPVVNTGVSGYKTDDIYNDLNKYVYMYNPTKVVLLIGTNDLIGKDNDYIINKIENIIKKIKENRPKTMVYLESIYPVNNTNNEKINHNMVNNRDNIRIKQINQKLMDICTDNICTYINMYDLLKDEDDNLKLDYTTDGLHISDEGYRVITKKLKEELGIK